MKMTPSKQQILDKCIAIQQQKVDKLGAMVNTLNDSAINSDKCVVGDKHHTFRAQTQNEQGNNVYEIHGTLFFASKDRFQELFEPKEDTNDVYIDFGNSKVLDHSAIQAIDKLAERYKRVGKTLHLQHLSGECRLLLKTAKGLVEVNVLEDPTYHVADDKLA